MSENVTHLKDYAPHPFKIDTADLTFELGHNHTIVTSLLKVTRNQESLDKTTSLLLNAKDMDILSIQIDGNSITEKQYTFSPQDETLIIADVPTDFDLQIQNKIYPIKNESGEGLYVSGKSDTYAGLLCTQCEAEGFRRITPYIDRPDNQTLFTTHLIGSPEDYPVMLSNGNKIAEESLPNGKQKVTWNMPFRMPCYLFALVAGTGMEKVSGEFTTCSGNPVELNVWAEAKDADKLDFALESLKKSMAWDETRFDREYNLNLFNIVVVDHFNMGAMENTSLNIFNSSACLAHPQYQTDADFIRAEAVIGHEYFHHWSGNLVTCRDWFQLSLKEGLTVFRDSEFTSDLRDRNTKRMEDIRIITGPQFSEDASPMAHPVQPQSYQEISNFYTLTVYEKGAEVIRMYQTLLGKENFAEGLNSYFSENFGRSATVEDFVSAMEKSSGHDLQQFYETWYKQAGTPTIKIRGQYDATARTYTLTAEQIPVDTPEQPAENNNPYHIPVRIGLVNRNGQDITLKTEDTSLQGDVWNLKKAKQSITFNAVESEPTPSLFRGFSAPVKLDYPYTQADILHLMTYDSDPINRWIMTQRLMSNTIIDLSNNPQSVISQEVVNAFGAILNDSSLEDATKAEMLTLPTYSALSQIASQPLNVDGLVDARKNLMVAFAKAHQDTLEEMYTSRRAISKHKDYTPSNEDMARRALQNLCLGYLCKLETSYAEEQFHADNMTEKLSALSCLVHNADTKTAQKALDSFIEKYQHDFLSTIKWFSVQASADREDVLHIVETLTSHPLFQKRNPNHLRVLYGTFAANPKAFHKTDGSGYNFLADKVIEVDSFNPQIASRLSVALTKFKEHTPERQKMMHDALSKIQAHKGLSKDTGEVIGKALKA